MLMTFILDLPRQKDEALPLRNSIGQKGDGLLVALPQVQKPGRGSQIEGFFLEVEEVGVHEKIASRFCEFP